MSDAVNHPKHYNSHPSGVEAIDICESLSFCLGNAVKYLFRAGYKGDHVEDLKKAAWYLKRAHAGEIEYSSPRKSVIDSILYAESGDSVLSEVLRSLFFDSGNYYSRVRFSLCRVEQEIERLSR